MSKEKKKDDNAVAKAERNITDQVLGRVTDMMERQELFMPSGYSPENALKSAWLTLQGVENKDHEKALNVCTGASICNALLDMVVQGLSPAKKQCYFIPYGKELALIRSYMGTVAVAKRFSDVKDVYAQVIYEKDVFEYEIDPQTGLKRIIKHTTGFDHIDVTKIMGAYAVVVRENAENYVEIMTMPQIKAAWNQGQTKGNSPAHKNFADEMAKKTVINRACKMFINTSDDSPLLTEAFNRTSESDYRREENRYYDPASDVVIDVADEDIKTEASKALFGGCDRTPFDDPKEMEKSAAAAAGDAAEAPEENEETEAQEESKEGGGTDDPDQG